MAKQSSPAKSEAIQFNRFERARIIGARALQIGMGAPVLIDVDHVVDPVKVSEDEYARGVIPVTVVRPTGRAMRDRSKVRVTAAKYLRSNVQ
ncbi:MAG TPA: DNA-directed RNA polymerase subunit K [Candidatus Thermoplasmatota archaeon]|nr:DNA-directed RNA polymerase subunit K [Candidatus Thermoplasmatota archaeon]